jgi:hypothetical protein
MSWLPHNWSIQCATGKAKAPNYQTVGQGWPVWLVKDISMRAKGWMLGLAGYFILCAVGTGKAIGQPPLAPMTPRENAGDFEEADPVLNDEVMSGIIPKGQGWHLFPQGDRFHVRGWLDGGLMGNTGNPASKFNGPYNAVDRANEAMFNQAYLMGEFILPTDGSFGFGGRVDLIYGEDYILAMSQGWEVQATGSGNWNSGQYYGLAMPQLYGEFGTNELSVKLGHFYTIVGYEGVPAVGNFFYSKAYSYQFAGPFTEWGGMGSWKPLKNLEVDAGLVNGWNTIDGTMNAVNFQGKARVQNNNNSLAGSFAIITGDQFSNVAQLPTVINTNANRTRYSLILEARPTNRVEYVFHQWLGTQNEGAPGGGTALWTGIDQYLYYSVSDQWKAGARFEWFQDTDGTRVGLNRPANPNKPPLPGNFFSLTVGPNYLPTENLLIRPELRWDFYNGEALPYGDGTKTQQLMLGFDMILKF